MNQTGNAFPHERMMNDDPWASDWSTHELLPPSAPQPAAITATVTHILLVDDEPYLCHFLRLSLQEAGYVVHTANNGEEAIKLFESHPINLVLTDIQMPLMDGYALCAQLRAHSAVPIIILSSASAPVDVLDGFRAGANEYIAKPFQWHDVEAKIQRSLQHAKLKLQ
jgi:DNA-binding response OmpR family regulator